jgi:hypothetical protein
MDNNYVYAWLTMFSWFSLLKFLRAFASMRVFIKLLVESIAKSKEFMLVLGLMLMTFTSTFHAHNIDAEPEALTSFIDSLKYSYRIMYGDFETHRYDLNHQWGIFIICTILITVVMMNLLIAIISDTFD